MLIIKLFIIIVIDHTITFLTCGGFTLRIRNMLALINYENLQVDVDTKVEDPLVNLHEDTSSTALTKSKDHDLENCQNPTQP